MDRVLQEQHGTRKLPISDKLNSLLTAVGDELDVYFVVTSGGQPSKGPNRTGSHRHDDGGAADLMAFKLGDDGNRHYFDQSVPEDRAVWSKIIQLSVAGGATGVGMASDYMGNKTAHIGFGKPAAWGAGGKTANAPKWVKAAYVDGQHTPPMNIPQVASKLDVVPPKSAAAPSPMPGRPAALGGSEATTPAQRPTVLASQAAAKALGSPTTILGGANVAGKAARDAAVSTILGGGSGVSKTSASPGRKLPNPTAAETRAEQVLGRKAAATPGARSIVPALGRSTEQVARDEQNAIQSGYRAVQEGHFPAAPNAQKQTPAAPAAASSQLSGVQKSKTVTVRPDGTERASQEAGTVAMPAGARPGATKNASGSPDDRDARPKTTTKTVTYQQPNPDYAAWEKQYGTGGANSALTDIHDKRDDATMAAMKGSGIASKFASIGSGVSTASIPKAPPRTITVTRTYQVADAHAAAAQRVATAKAAAAAASASRAAILTRAQQQAASAAAQAARSSMPQAGQTIMTENNGAQVIGSRLNGSERGYTVTNDNWFNSVRGL